MVEPTEKRTRPWEELRSSGLLWLINRVILHPRGYALALAYQGEQCIGWQLWGDGTEVMAFDHDDEHALFDAVSRTLNPASEGTK